MPMAKSSPSWGYARIQGAMANLGHKIAPNTVKRILKEHGIEPAPFRRRRTTWEPFLRSHWDTLAAADCFTTEIGLLRVWLRSTSCARFS